MREVEGVYFLLMPIEDVAYGTGFDIPDLSRCDTDLV